MMPYEITTYYSKCSLFFYLLFLQIRTYGLNNELLHAIQHMCACSGAQYFLVYNILFLGAPLCVWR